MQEPPPSDGTVGPPAHVGLMETCQDSSEDMLIACQRPLDVLIIDETAGIKKSHYHEFACGNFPVRLLRACLSFTPLPADGIADHTCKSKPRLLSPLFSGCGGCGLSVWPKNHTLPGILLFELLSRNAAPILHIS